MPMKLVICKLKWSLISISIYFVWCVLLFHCCAFKIRKVEKFSHNDNKTNICHTNGVAINSTTMKEKHTPNSYSERERERNITMCWNKIIIQQWISVIHISSVCERRDWFGTRKSLICCDYCKVFCVYLPPKTHYFCGIQREFHCCQDVAFLLCFGWEISP